MFLASWGSYRDMLIHTKDPNHAGLYLQTQLHRQSAIYSWLNFQAAQTSNMPLHPPKLPIHLPLATLIPANCEQPLEAAWRVIPPSTNFGP